MPSSHASPPPSLSTLGRPEPMALGRVFDPQVHGGHNFDEPARQTAVDKNAARVGHRDPVHRRRDAVSVLLRPYHQAHWPLALHDSGSVRVRRPVSPVFDHNRPGLDTARRTRQRHHVRVIPQRADGVRQEYRPRERRHHRAVVFRVAVRGRR